MTKIKICGLRRAKDIEYVNECNPDYIGFVFAKSRREVALQEAKKFREKLNPGIRAVGVFVNEDVRKVAEIINSGVVDLVQLHGDENVEYIARLRDLMKRGEIIKAIRVNNCRPVLKEDTNIDFWLFDTFVPGAQGGTGNCFDWNVLEDINKEYFLAGGIGVHNAKEAIKMLNPFAIDLSSAVEVNGFKDRERILEIVNLVRGVNMYE